MTLTTRKVGLTSIALIGLGALFTGCATAPETETTDAASSDFLPCMVSDSGGFDDKSFNQLGYEGLLATTEKLGLEHKEVESNDDTVYESNINNLVDEGCNLIVTVGFLLADATKAAAESNPDVDFAIIDDSSIVDSDNVKPVTFSTGEAAFLAGYSAASYSKTGIVGTFGGIQIPPVTLFMDGFADGVTYFNEAKGADVKLIGWDVAAQTGTFTGSFVAGVDAKTIAQGLIDQEADVILPVGGPIFLSAGEAIRDSGKAVTLVGVDTDAFVSAPDLSDLFLTSILKGVGVSVSDVITLAADGKFDSEPYVGTLENEGVGLAGFHDYESKVDPGLQGELDDIKAGIIDGSITVESPSAVG